MEVLRASEGKVFAYIDEEGNEVILGAELYLGINDDGSRYYEVDAPQPEEENTEPQDEEEPIEVEATE